MNYKINLWKSCMLVCPTVPRDFSAESYPHCRIDGISFISLLQFCFFRLSVWEKLIQYVRKSSTELSVYYSICLWTHLDWEIDSNKDVSFLWSCMIDIHIYLCSCSTWTFHVYAYNNNRIQAALANPNGWIGFGVCMLYGILDNFLIGFFFAQL